MISLFVLPSGWLPSQVAPSSHTALPDDRSTQQAARRAMVLRALATSTTLWPGDYIELELPQCFPPDSLHALEPRSVIPQVHLVNTSELWPPPGIISSVAGRIWIPNLSGEPIQLKRHEHFCLVAPSSPLVLMSCLNALPTSLSNQSTFRLLHLVPASHQLSALIQKISYSPIILLPPKWLWLCFRPHNPRL